MTFSLRIPSDGNVASVSCLSENDSLTSDANNSNMFNSTVNLAVSINGNGKESALRAPPKEFEIAPSSGTIAALSSIKISVTLCSNSVKKYETAMFVDVDGVGEELVSLPIYAK